MGEIKPVEPELVITFEEYQYGYTRQEGSQLKFYPYRAISKDQDKGLVRVINPEFEFQLRLAGRMRIGNRHSRKYLNPRYR